MKKIIFILTLSICINHDLPAQDYNNQKIEFALTNIGINGLIGGIGALINKRDGEKKNKVFLKGFSQGCLGGAFSVLGKELTYQIKAKNNLSYAWLARITNSMGNSISQNAASNIDFWERWHFNLGILRFDYYTSEKKFTARVFPSSFYGLIASASQSKLNLKRSLQMGIMVYEKDGNVTLLGREALGYAIVSSIAINKNISDDIFYEVMAHETMHILQYDNLVWFNPYFNKLDKKWRAKSKLYNDLSKYVYFDMNGPTIYGIYFTQMHRPWICRYLEREAEHFSNRIILPNCN